MLRLRPYKENDAKIIVSWIKDELAFRLWSADRYDHYPITAEDMNHHYAETGDDFFGMSAFDESGIVGHLTMRFVDEEKKILRFGFVIVDDSKRGKGYGREMLSLALRYASDILRVEKVTLGVFEENEAAYQCYKAVGFHEPGAEKTVYYEMLGRTFPCKEMEIDCSYHQMVIATEGGIPIKHDFMTGMYNQQGFLEVLEEWKDFCIAAEEKILFICVDVDHLGNINDIYGHSEGDVAIQTLAMILNDSFSDEEICAHLGSDEFVVAMHIEEDEEQIVDSFIHSVIRRVENYNQISGKEYSLEINHSYTVNEISESTNMQVALDGAFAKKRIVKNNRRNFSTSLRGNQQDYNPAEEKVVNKLLDDNCFAYAFQPIVSAKDGEIVAYEALMRSNREEPVSPFVILKYATKCQRLYDIERATFFNVMDIVSKKLEYFEGKQVFINSIPGYQLDHADYSSLRQRYAGIMEQMVVEVTEQTELNDTGLELLVSRSEQDNFGIAIDDYGTGYSNTSNLLRYLPNCVKIDRLLISNIHEDPKKQHFVKNIIEFAHDNGFLALAEGVETAAELRAVIRMGADLIQGYYTAKPSLEILQDIDGEIKKEIESIIQDASGPVSRKIYMVNNEKELILTRLSLEQYTGILVSQEQLTIIGNSEFTANMCIKIKDGSHCRLTLRNVNLESVQHQPCIDIGENASLTLVLEGDNVLNEVGIRVPEDSSLKLEGVGNLKIMAKDVHSYGIGNSVDQGVGSICCESSGQVHIHLEGNQCIGIGGGYYRRGDGVRIGGGSIEIIGTCESMIGIGCMDGSMPIEVKFCRLEVNMYVSRGIGIGTCHGDQNIQIANGSIHLNGSGNNICGVGSYEKTSGVIHVASCKLIIKLNGQHVTLLGNDGGGVNILTEKSGIHLTSEGSDVVAVGSFAKDAILRAKQTSFLINLHAEKYMTYGMTEANKFMEGEEEQIIINN